MSRRILSEKKVGEEVYKTIDFVYKIRLGFKQAVMDAENTKVKRCEKTGSARKMGKCGAPR